MLTDKNFDFYWYNIFVLFLRDLKVFNWTSLFFHILCLVRFYHRHIHSWPLSINHARKAVMCSCRCPSFLAFCKSKFIPMRGDFQSWFNVAKKPYACIGFLFFSTATGTTSTPFFLVEFHDPSVCKNGSHSQDKQYTNTGRIRAN